MLHRSSSNCLFRHGRVLSRPSTRLRFRPIRRCPVVSLNFQTRPGAGWRVWAIEMLKRAFVPLDGGRPSRSKPERSAAQKSRYLTHGFWAEYAGLSREGASSRAAVKGAAKRRRHLGRIAAPVKVRLSTKPHPFRTSQRQLGWTRIDQIWQKYQYSL